MAGKIISNKYLLIDTIIKQFPGINNQGIASIIGNIQLESKGGKLGREIPLDYSSIFTNKDLPSMQENISAYYKSIGITSKVEQKKLFDKLKDKNPNSALGIMYMRDADAKYGGGTGPLQLTIGNYKGLGTRKEQLKKQMKSGSFKGSFDDYMVKIGKDPVFGLEETLKYYKTHGSKKKWNTKFLNKQTAKTLGDTVINPGRTWIKDNEWKDFQTLATDSVTDYNTNYLLPPGNEGISSTEPYQRDGKMYQIVKGKEEEYYYRKWDEIQDESLLPEVTVSSDVETPVEATDSSTENFIRNPEAHSATQTDDITTQSSEAIPIPSGSSNYETASLQKETNYSLNKDNSITTLDPEGKSQDYYKTKEGNWMKDRAGSVYHDGPVEDEELITTLNTVVSNQEVTTDIEIPEQIVDDKQPVQETDEEIFTPPKFTSEQITDSEDEKVEKYKGRPHQLVIGKTTIDVPGTGAYEGLNFTQDDLIRNVDAQIDAETFAADVEAVTSVDVGSIYTSHLNTIEDWESFPENKNLSDVYDADDYDRALHVPPDIKQIRYEVERYNKITDNVLRGSDGEIHDAKEQDLELRAAILSSMTPDDILKAEADRFTDIEKGYIRLNGRNKVLENNQKKLNLENTKIIDEGEVVKRKQEKITSDVEGYLSEVDELQGQWKDIKQNGKFTYFGGVQRWVPNFQNEFQQLEYNEFLETKKDLDIWRDEINVEQKEFEKDVADVNGLIEIYNEEANKLYANIGFNQQEMVFTPSDPSLRYMTGEDGQFVISNSWNESIRDLGGKDNEMAKALDVVSSGASNYLEFKAFVKVFSGSMKKYTYPAAAIIVGGAAVMSWAGIGTTDLKNMRGFGDKKDVDGMISYDAMDFLADAFGNLSKKNILPTSNRPDANLFLQKPIEGQIFPYINSETGGWYKYGKAMSELLPYTLMLAGGVRKYAAGRATSSAERLRAVQGAGKGKQFRRLGLVDVGGKISLNPSKFVNSLQKRFKMGDRLANNLKQIDLTYKMLLSQNVAYARSEGLDGQSAFAMGSWMSLMTGISQSIMPDYLWFKGVKGKSLMKGLVNEMKKTAAFTLSKNITLGAKAIAFKKAGTQWFRNSFKELLEEELDVALNDVVKSNYLANHSPEVFDIMTQNHLVVGTMMLTGMLGSVQAFKTQKAVKNNIYYSLLKDQSTIIDGIGDKLQAVESEIKRLEGYTSLENWEKTHLKEMKKSKDALVKTRDHAFDIARAIQIAPEYVTTETIDLLIKKNKLVDEKVELLKSKDKVAVEKQVEDLNAKIEKVNEQIRTESYTVKKEKLNKILEKRGRKLAKDEGYEYYETKSREEYLEFANKENAKRAKDNKDLNDKIVALERDFNNYVKGGQLNEKTLKEIKKLKEKKQVLVPDTLQELKGKRAGGFTYYNDITKRHTIIINWDIARESKNFAVVQHEIMHAMLRQSFNTAKGRKMMTRMAMAIRAELLENPSVMSRYVINKFAGYDGGLINEANADELFTIMSEYMLQNNYRLSKSFLGKIGDMLRLIAREFGYNFKINNVNDVMNFIQDYSKEAKRGKFSLGMKKIKEKGLKGSVKLSAEQRARLDVENKITGAAKVSKSIYTDPKILEDLGLKESSKKIIIENARIRQLILDEGIEQDGKIVASPELQDALIANNMAAAVNLAKFAAANPKIMVLEEGKRVDFKQFLSGYYKELTELAGTYDASINEFGQYMNTILPLRYNQILDAEKKGEIEGSVSLDAEGVNEVEDTDVGILGRLDESESSLPGVNIAFKVGGEALQKEYEDHYEKGYLMIKNGPLKGQSREEWLEELKELGFVDAFGNIFDINNIDLANLQDLAVNITSKISGIDADKLNYVLNAKARKEGKIPAVKFMANLRIDESRGSNELRDAQLAMKKIGMALFVGPVLTEGFVGTTSKPIGSLKIRPNLQKLHYNKGSKKNNVQMFHKKPNIDIKTAEESAGIIDGKSFRADRNISANVHAYWNAFGKMVGSQSIRNVLAKHGDLTQKIRVALEDGKSKLAQSKYYKESAKEIREEIIEGLEGMSINLTGIIIDYQEDSDTFKQKTKELFKETFENSNVDYNKLYNQLFQKIGLLTIWGSMSVRYQALGMEAPVFKDFIEEQLENIAEDSQVFDSLGIIPSPGFGPLSKNAAYGKDGVERGRANLAEYAQELKKRVLDPKDSMTIEKAMIYLTMMGGMYKNASGIANKQFSPESKGSTNVKYNFVMLDSKRFRANVTESAQDYYDVINLATDNFFDISGKKLSLLLKDNSNAFLKELMKDGIDVTLEKRNAQADIARELFKDTIIRNWKKYGISENPRDRMMFAQVIFSYSEGMESPSRKAAKIWGIAEGLYDFKNNKYIGGDINKVGSDLEYDHNKPHRKLIQRSIEILSKNNEIEWNDLFDKAFEDYTISIITNKHNKAINSAGFQSITGPNYAEGSKMTDVTRGVFNRSYNDILLNHPDIKPILEIASRGKVRVGDGFVNVKAPKVSKSIAYHEVAKMARSIEYTENTKGISILDFDDTLATTKSSVLFTTPEGIKGKLNAEEYARDYVALESAGYKFDFSEFNKVIDGKVAPLFNKALKLARKFGTENMFVLTARPAEAAPAIYQFLKENGLEIPLANITGLENSTAEAKAMWIVGKVEEGYNDIYFADDALQNVQAVKNVVEQLDVKSKVQQAKASKSIEYSEEFNKILEGASGINAEKQFSATKGRKRGEKKGKYRFWIPPSAEDFMGLLYSFLGKGKKGDAQIKFFKKVLLDPFAKAITQLNQAKQQMANEYVELLKSFNGMRKRLQEKIMDDDFVIEDAVRVYLWNKAGYKIPGLSEKDKQELIDIVESDEKLLAFAASVGKISRDENGYIKPSEEWETDGIKHDLFQKSGKIKRAEFLETFKQNREIIFGKWSGKKLVGPNMNKIEAIYGPDFRSALEDVLWRMENGSNRTFGNNKKVNAFMNWVNGSVAAVMFVNVRSAVLQTLSMANFINWEENNMFAAASAFANQGQFWTDFAYLFNSDFLKQRRSGLTTDLNASELITHLSKTDNKAKAAVNWLLKKGFLPTQIADSFAISMGGATFYRNRVGKYISEGLDQQQAEEKAFQDFQEIAEATQQSARADMISQEQASPLGRLILAFQNTPMQYARLMKKAGLDLINGRGSTKSNISKIIYYGFVQNLIFHTLQTGLFALMALGVDDEDEELIDKKEARVLQGMLDTTLRGLGVGGAIVSTLKNMALKAYEQDKKGRRADYTYVLLEFLNLSPPVGIKARKLYGATQSWKWNKKEAEELGIVNLDNPIWEVSTGVTEAVFNAPVNRMYNKLQNISEALNSENETWQRIAVIMGWNAWDFGIDTRKKTTSGRDLASGGFEFADDNFELAGDDFEFADDIFELSNDEFEFAN